MTDYRLNARIPTVEEFCELRARNGLSPKTAEAAARGLPNSIHAVVIEHEGRAIGMGRVIGDGGTVYQITDIAVMAEHRGRGLGKRIVAALVDWLKANAPKSAYVSLIADGPAKDLYAQYGFKETAPESVGMAMWIV
ncbi:MAG: GNAT family N-acetyltransferase [Devosia sp.]|uniref:GNAT family N-acetyltransferase n=1 Tax=Devosia sp. TaxID=1871048 RepID=UPI001ACEF115|nr:GNAT family N-acetyltransferase [Devosia sp.]MBN9310699.1 GNAT family N-acetyltransferase [Devosia sp.]MBN9317327.1 GNAT family N-acetyltransferase [Devosia sp.]